MTTRATDDNLPKIHPRHEPTEAAWQKFFSQMIELQREFDLTEVEKAAILARYQNYVAGQWVSMERKRKR